MTIFKKIIPFVIIFLFLFLDQLTKNWILEFFYSIQGKNPIINITDFFNIVLTWNKGVSFGLFQTDNPYWLIGFSMFISLALLIWMSFEKKFLVRCGLAFIITGAIGNAVDRLNYGAVIDFLDFYYRNWHFPAFNVADISINIGVGLIIIDVLFFSPKQLKNK